MNAINVYILIIGTYGFLDIFFQKNSKTIFFSKSKDKTYLPILITFSLALTIPACEVLFLHRVINHFFFWLGAAMCLTGTYIRVKGQLELQHGFSTRIEKQENHTLITTGLYSLVRHPLYLALVLFLIGASFMLSSYYSWIMIIINAYTLKIRIDKEEAFLIENFPAYEDYQKRTKKIIPFIW